MSRTEPTETHEARANRLYDTLVRTLDRAHIAEADAKALTAERDRLAAEVERLRANLILCRCGQPATCFGSYEGRRDPAFSCSTCCGHGNEDGWCFGFTAEDFGREFTSIQRGRDDAWAEADREKEGREQAERSVEHTRQWWACRFEQLTAWARVTLDGDLSKAFFSIVANGFDLTAKGAPPTYLQLYNGERNRATAAEQRADREAKRAEEAERQSNIGICAYCAATFPRTPAAALEHMASCEKHPVKGLLARCEQYEARLSALAPAARAAGMLEESLMAAHRVCRGENKPDDIALNELYESRENAMFAAVRAIPPSVRAWLAGPGADTGASAQAGEAGK